MKKKHNQSKVGNNSLLQTARTKNFGVGKFALLSLKNKPQPPIKKVKVPLSLSNNNGTASNNLVDDVSKVSDITAASGEERDVIKQSTETNDIHQNEKSNEDDVESSVLAMSMNSKNSFDFSLSKEYVQGTTKTIDITGSREYTGENENGIQSTAFSSLWPAPPVTVRANREQLHNHLKNKKFVKCPKSQRIEITKKKTMDISEGLRFSAPAPMTLNRYQPQMGQEKTAPESKEYLEMQATKQKLKQKQIEEQHMAEAQVVVHKRLKQAYESGEIDAYQSDPFSDFGDENKNLTGNTNMKKKTLIKKILSKVRPQPAQKYQHNHEKSSAIQAAMSAAAAAVEVATGNPSVIDDDPNGPISEVKARAIVNKALVVSRQRQKEILSELPVMIPPSKLNDRHKLNNQEIISSVDQFGRRIQFPINEVMMKLNEDSISDLDTSTRNLRKIPMIEIHMKDTKQCQGDESVSTLGTPRVFEQLDKLLLSQTHRFQQPPDLMNDFLEENMGGSAAPPPMVTSHDARALIDQLDSGTMAGDMTAGTVRAENAVKFCNIASTCFHPDQRSLFVEPSHRTRGDSSAHGEESYDESETSSRDKTSNDETWSSPTPFSQAIDDAIRKAEIKLTENHFGHLTKHEDAQLTFVEEAGELIASPYGSEIALRESKSRSTSPRTIPTSSQINLLSQPDQEKANFDSLMNIAASKLNTVIETHEETRQEEYHRDRYSTEIDHSSKEKMNMLGNETTPRAQGGIKEPLFGQTSRQYFSEDQFDLLSDGKSDNSRIYSATQVYKHLEANEHNATNTSKRKKSTTKPSSRIHTLGGMMNQGRFLLEKDDAYWDTLSTIASTANDRSAESNTYMNKFAQPGPIPGEITTSSSEMKSIANSVDTENFNPISPNGIRSENIIDPNQHLGKKLSSPSHGKLNEMINDVTDLIDADLLDNLPVSKNKNSKVRMPLNPENCSGAINRNQARTNLATTKKVYNRMRSSSHAMDRSKAEESQSGSLSISPSQIAKGIRSVSWGFEEIYEDRNSQLDISLQDINSPETYGISRKAQPCPEGTQESQRRSLHSSETQKVEEDVFSRTVELSKDLLNTIMGSQIVKVQNKREEDYKGLKSSRDVQDYKMSHRTENPTNTEHRDDFHDDEHLDLSETSENGLPPMISNRIESLRKQRSQALMKFRQIQNMEPRVRDRERLSPDFNKLSYRDNDQTGLGDTPHESLKKTSYGEDSDIELKYTTSESNDSTTPSQRARDLRKQLDEAMRASREIQISQNQLGNELNSFKKRYYRNPGIGAHKV